MRLSIKQWLPLLLLATLAGCNSIPKASSDIAPEVIESADVEKDADKEETKETSKAAAQKPDDKHESAQVQKDTPKVIVPALEPGTYCYEFDDELGGELVRLTVDKSDRVTGDVQGVVTDEAEGYYTSYTQKVDGTIDGSNLNVDVTTWIEYDKQNRQETWRVSPKSLTMTGEPLPKANCSLVNKAFQNENGIEAKDLTAYANNVRRFPVFFDAGESGTTVSDAVVRGDRDVYVVGAQGGQQMYLSITSVEDNAVFDVIDPSGIILGTEMTDEMIYLPHTGDYEIIVGGTRGNATYDLSIDIE